jgi:exosortase D (VPLPA-CTERM-specific)
MNALMATAGSVWNDSRGRLVLLVLSAVAIAAGFAFWNAFVDLGKRYAGAEELSHSYFLPLVAAWMLWERRGALAASVGAPVNLALVGAAFGVFLVFLGGLSGVEVLMHLGWFGFLLTLPLLFGGWSLFWVSLIPLAYLVFMIPPPPWVITRLTHGFQLMSSELGVAMLRAMGATVFLSGNVIHLTNGVKLEVAEACAGLNYLFPFLSLGALAAYFYKGPLWQRVVIFLSTIPITILMNSLRIALTGVLVENYGSQHTEGALHFFEGWVVFLFCIAFLLLVIWGLTLLRGERKPLAFVGFEEVAPKAPTGQWTQEAFVRNGIIVTVILLLGGAFVHTMGNRSLIIPERQEFSTLPFEFEGWTSRQSVLEPVMVEVLGADDYIITDMTGPEGEQVNLYIAYLDAQRGERSWHSPQQCLPGGGWVITSNDIVTATQANGEPWPYNRLIIEQNDNRILVNYWYDQRGRKMANEFVVKGSVIVDSLTRRRADGAMIRVMTPIAPTEQVEDAEARIAAMRKRLEAILPAYVPGRELDAPAADEGTTLAAGPGSS